MQNLVAPWAHLVQFGCWQRRVSVCTEQNGERPMAGWEQFCDLHPFDRLAEEEEEEEEVEILAALAAAAAPVRPDSHDMA